MKEPGTMLPPGKPLPWGLFGVRLTRLGIACLLLGGASLFVYNRRVGIADPEGISMTGLLLRPDIWFGAAIISALLLLPRRCLGFGAGSRRARLVLRDGPACALASGAVGSVLGWWRYGVLIDGSGEIELVRFLLGILLGVLVYNLSLNHGSMRRPLRAVLMWAPLINVLLALAAAIVPSFLHATLGPDILKDGGGLFAYGARFQGLTTNPNMVATSSTIAAALLLPGLGPDIRKGRPVIVIKVLYLMGLIDVIAWSGVRAAAVALLMIGVGNLLLSFKLTKRGVARLAIVSAATLCAAAVGVAFAWTSGTLGLILERFSTNDGRLFLWKLYCGHLMRNPLGMGFGFESIVHTTQIVMNARLPPHNTFLSMAVIGGWPGLLAHIAVTTLVLGAIRRMRPFSRDASLSLPLRSMILAWCASAAMLLFYGLAFTDYPYVVVTALLLAEINLATPRHRPESGPSAYLEAGRTD